MHLVGVASVAATLPDDVLLLERREEPIDAPHDHDDRVDHLREAIHRLRDRVLEVLHHARRGRDVVIRRNRERAARAAGCSSTSKKSIAMNFTPVMPCEPSCARRSGGIANFVLAVLRRGPSR